MVDTTAEKDMDGSFAEPMDMTSQTTSCSVAAYVFPTAQMGEALKEGFSVKEVNVLKMKVMGL